MPQLQNLKRNAKQLAYEFWLPLVVAIAWMLWTGGLAGSGISQTIMKYVSAFGGAFFLVSYFTGQYFRVRKQTQTQERLEDIIRQLDAVAINLNGAAAELVSHATGGDSTCHLYLTNVRSNASQDPSLSDRAQFQARNQGRYPLYGVSVRFHSVDGNAYAPSIANFLFGDVPVGQTVTNGRDIAFEPGSAHKLQLEIFARNGSASELLVVRLINGVWRNACLVVKDGAEHWFVEEGFPRHANGKPIVE